MTGEIYDRLTVLCGKRLETASNQEIYVALMRLVRERSQDGNRSVNGRKLYYISAEFLIGKLLSNNLINLGLYDDVKAALAKAGKRLSDIEELENEPSLGNGGLGRLAACFLDSLATLGLPGDGIGLRYHCGLFHQNFSDGLQNTTPDYWLSESDRSRKSKTEKSFAAADADQGMSGLADEVDGASTAVDDPVWEMSGQVDGADDVSDDTEMDWVERTKKTYTVTLAGKEYSARLYRLAVIGYDAEADSRLQAAYAASPEAHSVLETSAAMGCKSAADGAHRAVTNYLNLFDLDTIDESIIEEGISFDKTKIDKNLTLFLYPDDADETGQLLRIYQQYLMVSAGAQMILDECAGRGSNYHDLAKYAAIQINDTHPSMVIPELIRLLGEKGIAFEEAVQIVTDTCAYTNHTILAEALEKWPRRYLDEVVPQLMPIIEKLDQLSRERTEDKSTCIIDENGLVHMAHMDIHFSHSTNGVAALHTKILEDTELANFYQLYPEKFNNKTNGITFRRWLLKCNPLLSAEIESLIGPGFKTNADELEKLMLFTGEDVVLNKLFLIKKDNKKALADWLYRTQGVRVNPDAMFLIQSKRLHEYKRQQLNLLFLIHQYYEIKAGHTPAVPIVSIFGAKAAPAYVIAQDIIHALLTLSKVIADDPEVSKWMQIVFVENYNVTAAEKMIPACDLSEQISLASKEASGTGNMKFMLNGALTLGTMDGANVEIAERVGEENLYIFGQTSEQVIRTYAAMEEANRNGQEQGSGNGNRAKSVGDAAPGVYIAKEWYQGDPNIRRAIDFLTSEQMLAAGHEENLSRLQNELIGKDWFQTLPDFNAYVVRKTQAMLDYATDPRRWTQRALINIAQAGYFSSDRTIREYNDEIWHLGE